MKKTLLTILILTITLFSLTSCKKEEQQELQNKEKTPAQLFKEDYEKLNGKTNADGKEHRTITINEDNPFEEITPQQLLEKLNNYETFYVYFGSSLCPWCRSVIEKAIETAHRKNVQKIYYVDIWDEEGNEILRDKYELQNNKPVKVKDGTEEYTQLLDKLKSVLKDYELKNEDGKKIKTGEKRIYAPNFIYFQNGKPKKITDGISSLQKDPREKLTTPMLEETDKLFVEFYDNVKSSTSNSID